MFQKILIANRGEIAVRIIRACREMGILSVAVYSEADRESLHTQLADEAVCIGKAPVADSYLNMERVLSAAIATKAQAIHPGFGFLSENEHFAAMCESCGIAFIGPSGDIIGKMGNKSQARLTMMEAGVPVVPGTKEPVYEWERGLELAKEIGFPVMIKASSGGGGKGMRIAADLSEFENHFRLAQQESINAFGDNTMYIEKYIEEPRHIEIQILADKFGNVLWLGERDCSIQRRHQKMIEESPCAIMTDDLRQRMGETAALAAKAAHYENAGTIEFLLDKHMNFYSGFNADAVSSRKMQIFHSSRTGHEIPLRIFCINPAFNGMAFQHNVLLTQMQRLSRRNPNLFFHQINSCHHLCHRMLHLNSQEISPHILFRNIMNHRKVGK